MAGLQHGFAPGIRFDMALEYRVSGRWGPRYRMLPLRLPVRLTAAGHVDGGLLCAVQCTALVGQKPFRPLLAWFLAQGWTAIDQLGPAATLKLDGHGEYGVRFESIRTSHATTIGALALQALRDGHPCMVQLASRHGARWATGIGAEWQTGHDQARALLLLDPLASEPWGCGYNARLELWHERQGVTGDGTGAGSTDNTVKLRHLSGEVWTVRILQFIRVGLVST